MTMINSWVGHTHGLQKTLTAANNDLHLHCDKFTNKCQLLTTMKIQILFQVTIAV